MTTNEICASRGPRVGYQGAPYCKLALGHDGWHRSHPDDGWDSNSSWGEPPMYSVAVRREFAAAGIEPYVPE